MKKKSQFLFKLIGIALGLAVFWQTTNAQETTAKTKIKQPSVQSSKKINQRPPAKGIISAASAPFDKASVETMAEQCVKFETGSGIIELEMFPESAPESVRNFLNLTAAKAFDTTTFNRVVPGFIVQGGDLFTREKMTTELDKRGRQTLLDEPNLIKHERGILSMARTDAPNSATTNFFILVGQAKHLDGTFAAFGRVTRGMEIVDAINKMPLNGEKPIKPVRLIRATTAICTAPATQ
jgi:peptidyl-prolyl cis-trans isomerase B (cyclophilin B)